MTVQNLIHQLQGQIQTILDPLLPAHTPLALVDFPDHPNVGDSAIWLGELAYLRSRSREPAYLCQIDTYSRQSMKRAIADGIVLIHGGGNFGDLWKRHQRFRERIIRDFPNNRIIQLPQTIHFSGSAALADARALMNAHGAFTILARDRRSFQFARDQFDVPSMQCPDMAFCIGPLARPVSPTCDALILSRTDLEKRYSFDITDTRMKCVDWLEEPRDLQISLDDRLKRFIGRHPTRLARLHHLCRFRYRTLAQKRVDRGASLLSEGRCVVTDRLHAHILCLLLGIPHFFLDNNYGKNREFYESWTSGSEITTWCESEDEAVAKARALLA